MFRYVYIDESGDLGNSEKSSAYLVLAAVIIKDPAPLERLVKNMRRHKFKKELNTAYEIKANNSKPGLIKHILIKLNEVPSEYELQVVCLVLEKKRLYSEFLKSNKNKLYNYIAGKLARYLPIDNVAAEIRIDKSTGKQVLQEEFNTYFRRKLEEKHSVYKILIHHSYSNAWIGPQIADIIAWSVYQKFGRQNSEYLDMLKIPVEIQYPW